MNTNRSPISPLKMIWRGVRVRCPRCGGGGLFVSWFKMRERCPTCAYKIVREEGFWLGGYVMNVGIGEGLLALYMLVFAGYITTHTGAPVRPWLIAAIILAVVPPIALFKMSRTTWMAIDLLIHPLEPWEVADADLAKAEMEH